MNDIFLMLCRKCQFLSISYILLIKQKIKNCMFFIINYSILNIFILSYLSFFISILSYLSLFISILFYFYIKLFFLFFYRNHETSSFNFKNLNKSTISVLQNLTRQRNAG